MLPEEFLFDPADQLFLERLKSDLHETSSQSNGSDTQQRLIENIHRLIGDQTAWILGVILSLLYISMMIAIFRKRNKPHIQVRSPILMLIITFGLFLDSLLKLIIIATDYDEIDVKCQLAIASRVVFYYIAYVFILIRISRVHSVHKLIEQLFDNNNLNQDSKGKVFEQIQGQKHRKFFRDKIQIARMQREERVITNACVNYIVPLAILGLLANFIPYLLVIVPLEEQDVCWFYYLTRSPYQLETIQPTLYLVAESMKYVIYFIEFCILIFSIWQIKRVEQMSQIDITTESTRIGYCWISFSTFAIILKLVENSQQNKIFVVSALQISIFAMVQLRNFLTALIAYYYSIYLVEKSFEHDLSNQDGDQQNLGTFAIEDFDVAMKSHVPVDFFRKYILHEQDHYKQSICQLLAGQTMSPCNVKKNVTKDLKFGEIFLNLFQLITIYNLVTLQKKAPKGTSSMTISQKDIIVEIVRLLDKHLHVCFP